MSSQSEWTWIIYMAGDNNLEGEGKEDLKEMKEIGSTSQLKIIVQFDTEENRTTRYLVEKNKLTVLQELPGVNTGDPAVLTDFIRWAAGNYPSRHYLIDIWNHGGGWENLPSDYDYGSIRSSKPIFASKFKRIKRSLFRTTVEKIYQLPPELRAIAIDVGSHDYLDNKELRDAIFSALPNGNKIDILGCDACLMNMLEICYENKDVANIMVGSEETEPGAGWPYTLILSKLAEAPDTSPTELAKIITQEYGNYYNNNGDPLQDKSATQSALDLSHVEKVAESVDELARILIRNIQQVAGQVTLARDKAQKFTDTPEYIDLISFVNELTKWIPNNEEVKYAVLNILNVLNSRDDRFVIANTWWGITVNRASGVSIYFPTQERYLKDYEDLTFSKNHCWKDLLQALFKL